MRWEDDSIEEPYYSKGYLEMGKIWKAYLNSARKQIKKGVPCPTCGKLNTWGYCSEKCMELWSPLQPIFDPAWETRTNVPMKPEKLEVKIWACIECRLVWRQPQFHPKYRPACSACGDKSSTMEITWYEATLAARIKHPGAEAVLKELEHERK